MKESKELTITNPNELTKDKVDLVKRMIAKDATDDELSMFIGVCNKTQLDPFTRQIYMIKRQGKQCIQASIDGLRLVAQRSGEYTGQCGPFWCAKDGIWKDIWTDDAPPYAAKVGIMRKGFVEPVWGIAKYKEYAVEGAQGFMWIKMPATMIAKCAEALGLRKAFPQELSGIYSTEEIHSEGDSEDVISIPSKTDTFSDFDTIDPTEKTPSEPVKEKEPEKETTRRENLITTFKYYVEKKLIPKKDDEVDWPLVVTRTVAFLEKHLDAEQQTVKFKSSIDNLKALEKKIPAEGRLNHGLY
jgi:phage recombination protein Bet